MPNRLPLVSYVGTQYMVRGPGDTVIADSSNPAALFSEKKKTVRDGRAKDELEWIGRGKVTMLFNERKTRG